MSHFLTLVLLPSDTEPEHAAVRVDDMMEPYAETDQWFGDGTRWDWWQIGGRWTGALDPSYDPQTDPANIETCRYCDGTGYRDDDVAREIRQTQPDFKCNVCDGKGEHLKWATGWREFEGDVRRVADVPEVPRCLMLMLPDGTLKEKARMGWFAIEFDEDENGNAARDAEEWDQTVRAILEEHSDHLVAAVDCHV